MGAHYSTIDLGTDGGIPHYLHVAADSDRALEVQPEVIEHYKNLVKEAGALFGARHYRDYHFLFTLSDHVAHFGLEHHESSDDRYGERTLIDPDHAARHGYLLPHEFVHSWNGKYRRPAGLMPNGKDGGYDMPMKGDLLWVYEGPHQLPGRSAGAAQRAVDRRGLPRIARRDRRRTGQRVRPHLASAGRHRGRGAGALRSRRRLPEPRRSVDYYPEGTLIWLEVDVMIRQLSKGAKSLDDFCRAFHGGAERRRRRSSRTRSTMWWRR